MTVRDQPNGDAAISVVIVGVKDIAATKDLARRARFGLDPWGRLPSWASQHWA